MPMPIGSQLVPLQRALYLMGTHAHYGKAIIRRSDDAGRTWTTPRDQRTGPARHTAAPGLAIPG